MSEHRIGQWPVDEPVDLSSIEGADEQGELHLALTKAQAAWAMPLETIRVDLEAQPSEVCLRAAQRRWQNAISQIADEAARQLRRTG